MVIAPYFFIINYNKLQFHEKDRKTTIKQKKIKIKTLQQYNAHT